MQACLVSGLINVCIFGYFTYFYMCIYLCIHSAWDAYFDFESRLVNNKEGPEDRLKALSDRRYIALNTKISPGNLGPSSTTNNSDNYGSDSSGGGSGEGIDDEYNSILSSDMSGRRGGGGGSDWYIPEE